MGGGVVLGPDLDWVPRGSTPRPSTNFPVREVQLSSRYPSLLRCGQSGIRRLTGALAMSRRFVPGDLPEPRLCIRLSQASPAPHLRRLPLPRRRLRQLRRLKTLTRHHGLQQLRQRRPLLHRPFQHPQQLKQFVRELRRPKRGTNLVQRRRPTPCALAHPVTRPGIHHLEPRDRERPHLPVAPVRTRPRPPAASAATRRTRSPRDFPPSSRSPTAYSARQSPKIRAFASFRLPPTIQRSAARAA